MKAQFAHKPAYTNIFFPFAVLGLFCVFTFMGTEKSWALVVGAENCADGHPCKVVFTLDAENNIVLEEVSGSHHRNEGVLRLTTDQAKAAANGPKSESNILAPKLKENEFSDTIKALAAVPGLRFLKGESPSKSGRAGSGTADAVSGARRQNLPQKCRQIEKVMAATLKDTKAGTLNKDDFITAAEVHDVCPKGAAKNLISWYETEKQKHLSY